MESTTTESLTSTTTTFEELTTETEPIWTTTWVPWPTTSTEKVATLSTFPELPVIATTVAPTIPVATTALTTHGAAIPLPDCDFKQFICTWSYCVLRIEICVITCENGSGNEDVTSTILGVLIKVTNHNDWDRWPGSVDQ